MLKSFTEVNEHGSAFVAAEDIHVHVCVSKVQYVSGQ